MTLQGLAYGQDDLAGLCAARPVFPTEYHIQNELYGLHLLLQEHAGLPPGRPLPWAMEHAINFGSPEPYVAEAESPLPVRLAVTEGQAEVLRARCGGPVFAIGSAFFYMRMQYARGFGEPYSGPRRGTLVFPDKSTTHQDTDYDRERFAAELAGLPEEYQPVAVSVFWRDWERGAHEPFSRAGLTLVTSGHPYDPLFLFRQYDLCRRFRYACANDLSTSFCLSVLSGCRFFHWPTGGLRVTRGGRTRHYESEPTLRLPGKKACLAASPFPPAADGAEQLRLAAHFAGEASVREPEFFRRLHEEVSRALFSIPAARVDFNAPGRADRAAGWGTWGIDSDGWARSECGLAVRGEAARLEAEVPTGAAGRVMWEVWHGATRHWLPASPGRVEIELPAGPADVRIVAGEEVPLAGEARRRAFRVVRLEALGRPARMDWAWADGPEGPVPAPGRAFDLGRGEVMSGWAPVGLSPDGWAEARCSLLVCAPPGARGARLVLGVQPGHRGGRLEVRTGGEQIAGVVSPGRWELDVPATPGRAAELVIEAEGAFPIGGGDQRRRAFRMLSARWLPSGVLALRRRPWWRWLTG